MQKPKPTTSTIELTDIDYSSTKSFWIASGAVIAILVALYATWW
jgi:SSS family solute:Na+ symporter